MTDQDGPPDEFDLISFGSVDGMPDDLKAILAEARDGRERYWVLDGKEPRPVSDPFEWAAMFESSERFVAQNIVRVGKRKRFISTIFLGIDHGFNFNNQPGYKPVLFESMVFTCRRRTKMRWPDERRYVRRREHPKNALDQWQERYTSWDAAVEGHQMLVERVTHDLTPHKLRAKIAHGGNR